MKRVFSAKALVLAGVACATAGVAALVACSSTSGNPGGSSGGGNEGGSGTTSLTCTTSTVPIVFNPMYSAYVTDNQSGQTLSFQVPAVVNDSVIDPSTVTWAASDTSVVSLATDPTTGGEMITVQKPGTVTIVAQIANGGCGTSTLTITPATYAQWQAGNGRYNNNVALDFRCLGGGTTTRDGGPCPDAGPACTQCHGPTANAGIGFNDVGHTPEQTGGFSDQDLIAIITTGTVPGCGTGSTCPTADSGYFDPSIVSYSNWQQFHQWTDIQGDQAQAMVVYLRSLTPAPQGGSSDFGGHYDGGHGDGGHHHDGGFGEGGFQPDGGGGSPEASSGADASGD